MWTIRLISETQPDGGIDRERLEEEQEDLTLLRVSANETTPPDIWC
jgi:hypothetical protein